MAGTSEGGKKAAQTNKARYGTEFYAKIGAVGGTRSSTGGFYSAVCEGCEWMSTPHRKAECAGAKGGTISRRGKAIK